MSPEGQAAVERAFKQLMRERTGSNWEIERLGGPATPPDGKLNPAALQTKVESAGHVLLALSGSHENTVESGG